MFSAIAGLFNTAVDKIFPDAGEALRVKKQFETLVARGELDLAVQQIKVNLEETKHGPKISWRQLLGYTCALIFMWQFLLGPMLAFLLSIFGIATVLPALDAGAIYPIMMTMLGAYGVKGYEKVKMKQIERKD